MHIEFANKTVIVTGAAHGFGRAIAQAFAARGANVWACDLIAAELTETQALCRADGGQCSVRTVDVSNPSQVTAFVNEAIASAASGHIDIETARRRHLAGRLSECAQRLGEASGREPTGEGGQYNGDAADEQDARTQIVEHPIHLREIAAKLKCADSSRLGAHPKLAFVRTRDCAQHLTPTGTSNG